MEAAIVLAVSSGSLASVCYLTASTHYSSGTLIPECNGVSQFKEDAGEPSEPVREISLIAL